MEQDLIIKYLVREIRYHDCIIIPEFGGFIGSYESAYFDEHQGKYFPPSKALIFNTAIQNNDGLLATIIKDGEGVSYISALSIIENCVNNWKAEIEAGNRIEIGDFGYVYKTKLGHIQFYQNKAINLYPGSFGLTAVTATGAAVVQEIIPQKEEVVEKIAPKKVEKPKVEVETETKVPVINLNPSEDIQEEKSEKSDNQEEIVHPASRNFKFKRKYLMAASMIPFLFYSYWIPFQTDFVKTKSIQISDFNPFATPKNETYAPRNSYLTDFPQEEFTRVDEYLKALSPDTKTFSYPFAEDCFIPVKLEPKPMQDSEVENQPEENLVEDKVESPKEIVKNTPSGSYHIIAGCFGEKQNAMNLVSSIKSKGYSAYILDTKGGLHRVAASSFNSRIEALSARNEMKANGISGWLLKK